MSLFPSPGDGAERARVSRRQRFGWWCLAGSLVAVIVLVFVPTPYVMQVPGPVFDTIGTVEVEGDQVDMLAVDAETFDTSGSLDLLTVSVVGSRSTPLDWFSVVRAWFDPSRSVLPVDSVYPHGTSFEQREQENLLLMQTSQREAVAAALRHLGHEVGGVLTVATVEEGYPADGVFEVGDVIVTAGGRTLQDVSELRAVFAEGGEIEVVVQRGGRELPLTVTPVTDAELGYPVVGVGVGVDYEFPVDVEVTLENVGGPSAGMMLTLGIIDKLTPGEMTGGERIAGTGTIDGDGEVGEIGGARQKMYGAADAGADWMLVPQGNCADVGSARPSGITVVPVATLTEALDAVAAIADGRGPDLPGC